MIEFVASVLHFGNFEEDEEELNEEEEEHFF